ncbi:MAG: hypothetical protein FGM33_06230 [Candidatus Kapabacteria bacterium]|nr:hypothetical protein [Candidatus Kapabacteria bacterium]
MNIFLSAAAEIEQYLVGIINLVIPRVAFTTPGADSVEAAIARGADSLKELPQAGGAVSFVSTPMHGHDGLSIISDIFSTLIPVAFAVAAAFILWKRIEARKAVELAMIEKGLTPRGEKEQEDSTRKFRALRFGILLLGIGLGLAASLIVFGVWNVPDEYRPLVVWSSVTFSAGLALTIYHIIATSLEKI